MPLFTTNYRQSRRHNIYHNFKKQVTRQPDGCKVFVLLSFLCVKEKSNFIFINNEGKQHKMLNKSTVHWHTNQVKTHFYKMNGVHVLTVKSHVSGDEVQRLFLSGRCLSKHFYYATLVN